MSFDLKSLELFVRVAAIGGIAKAGLEFGYSATTASQRIQALEDQLGCKLLNRTTRSVSLSADGEIFLAHAKRILADVEEAVADIQGDATTVKGELRIAASASFGRRYIAPHIAEFLSLNPEASIQLDLSDSVVDIVEHGIDLAIRIGVLAPSSLKARKLAVNPRVLVASTDYLEKHGVPSKPQDLASHNCIILGEARVWGLKFPNGAVSETKVSGNFSTTYGEAVSEAAMTGLGIAQKSKWDIRKQLADGSLVQVLDNYAVEPEWNVWAVRPPARLAPARVRVFTDFIEQKLRDYEAEAKN